MSTPGIMMQRAFRQVDVFTDVPYFGNPLAVVLDGSGLNDTAMQRFARWTNLSETAFLLPPIDPSADYRVRIFTPGGELPFAGHPTLGSCHCWLQAGGQPRRKDLIVQECQIGLVKIRRDPATPTLAFAAPPLLRSEPSLALLTQVAAALGLRAKQMLAAQVLDSGPVWLGLLLDSPETVLQLNPDHLALEKLNMKVGIAGLYGGIEAHTRQLTPLLIARANREARAFSHTVPAVIAAAPMSARPDLEVRAFAASAGIFEDPVTGSLNASLAQWLMADGLIPDRYLASQGVCMDREGRVHVSRDAAGQVWVGGDAVTCINGSVTL